MGAYERHIGKQHNIHNKRIDNCRKSHLSIVKNEWRGGYCYCLRRILHTYLYVYCALYRLGEPEEFGKRPTQENGQQYKRSCREPQCGKVCNYLLCVLQEKESGK